MPNAQSFWDNPKNATTNYGPAYRDTVERPAGSTARCKCPVFYGKFPSTSYVPSYVPALDTKPDE
ncbi:MAG: hypothetical protein J0I21_02555 [Alphaproteobacteria bacterium]|nr:hypothetical protein [Alphaproteobacteria bacterium]